MRKLLLGALLAAAVLPTGWALLKRKASGPGMNTDRSSKRRP